jgi:putative tricarboxylic transport membrane protein
MEIKNPDLVSGIFWGILGLLFSIWSFTYQLWSLNQPGPGLFPLLLGILLIFLSFLLLLSQVKKHLPNKEKTLPFSMPGGWKKVVYTIIVLLFAIFLFEKIGYLLTFFLLMISLGLGEKLQSWKVTLLVALFSALGVYLIFVLLLKQELPRGLLGI